MRTLNTTHSQKYIFIFLPVNIADVGQRVSELIERKEEGITHLVLFFSVLLPAGQQKSEDYHLSGGTRIVTQKCHLSAHWWGML